MASRGGACSVLIGPLLACALLLGAPAALLGGVTGADATPAPPQPAPQQSPAAELASILRMAGIPAEEVAPQHQAAEPQLTVANGVTEQDERGQAGCSMSHCKRDRVLAALQGQPLTVDVTPRQCQWLTDTVDARMRWLLHHKTQPIGDYNMFPRIWCAHRCSCRAISALLQHAALCVCTSHASGADEPSATRAVCVFARHGSQRCSPVLIGSWPQHSWQPARQPSSAVSSLIHTTRNVAVA